MATKISTTNSKLGPFIPTNNQMIEFSCRNNLPCKQGGCYGKRGTYCYDEAKKSALDNWLQYRTDPEKYFQDIIDYLNNGDVIFKYFRWHSVGDIVDTPYLLGMIEVAKKCKHTSFLCYTKKFDIVNNYIASGGKLPKNLKMVFSGWDKDFEVVNPYNFPATYVRFKKKSRNVPNLKGYECNKKCSECKLCWHLKKGEIVIFKYH